MSLGSLPEWKKARKEKLQVMEEATQSGRMHLGDFWPREVAEAHWKRKLHPEELDKKPCPGSRPPQPDGFMMRQLLLILD